MWSGLRPARHAWTILTSCATLTACSDAPSVGVLGAYFPDWLFCIVAGVVLTIVIHLIASRLRASHLIGPAAVVYPTLVAFLSLVVWLVLFEY